MTLERRSHVSFHIPGLAGLRTGNTVEAGTGRHGPSRGSSRHKYPLTRSYLGHHKKVIFQLMPASVVAFLVKS